MENSNKKRVFFGDMRYLCTKKKSKVLKKAEIAGAVWTQRNSNFNSEKRMPLFYF